MALPDPSPPHAAPPGAPRVVVLSDDPGLAQGIADPLHPGPLIAHAGRPESAASVLAESAIPEAAVVDLRARPEAGLQALRALRGAMPVLAVVADDDVEGAAAAEAALQSGAAGFCRAAGGWELRLRVRALLQASRPPTSTPTSTATPLRHGELEVDRVAGIARRRGVPLALTPRQVKLLAVLMAHPGEVVPRQRLEAELSLTPGRRACNLVEVHIHHLRRCIEGDWLRTLRGRGYVLLAEPQPGRPSDTRPDMKLNET